MLRVMGAELVFERVLLPLLEFPVCCLNVH
jgi:hypothetical protein